LEKEPNVKRLVLLDKKTWNDFKKVAIDQEVSANELLRRVIKREVENGAKH